MKELKLSGLVGFALDDECLIVASAEVISNLVVLLRRSETEKPQRCGFMEGQIKVPDDFASLGQDEIDRLFRGSTTTEVVSGGVTREDLVRVIAEETTPRYPGPI